jgi:hypothetical protein
MISGRFAVAIGLILIANLVLSSKSSAANSCGQLFDVASDLPSQTLAATAATMEKGQIIVSGFIIVSGGDYLRAGRADEAAVIRYNNRIDAEPGFKIRNLTRLTDSEIVVEYHRAPVPDQKIVESSSVQILKIDREGRFHPVQKFDGNKAKNISFRDAFDGGNGLVLETRGDMNSGNTLVVFRRSSHGDFSLAGVFPKTEYTELGPSAIDPKDYFFATRFSYFHPEYSLYKFVSGSMSPKLLLSGGKREEPGGILHNPEPPSIYRLTGDFFGRGETGSSSLRLREIEVFQVTPKGAEKIGDIPVNERDLRDYDRRVEAIDPQTIAVLDNFSYWSGVIGQNTEFAHLHRDLDLSIVQFKDGKLETQTLNLEGSAKYGSPDAIRLQVQPLNSTELLLTGPNYVQVVRANEIKTEKKSDRKFEVAEVIRIKGFKHEPLPGERMEVVRVSATRFIIQDRYVLDRLIPHDYASQFHVFDLVDGQYRLTSSTLLKGRRFGNTTVLSDGRLLLDVRSYAGRDTPSLQILNLDEAN